MTRHRYELPWGASHRDGYTEFRLWAPDAEAVHVELPERAPVALTHTGHGTHAGVLKCAPGTPYRYVIGELRVPDPMSRRQHGGVTGASEVVDPEAWRWKHADWQGRPWHEMTICELHAGCLGGFAGVEKFLPQLKRNGYTAIELMPVADFQGRRNWGYDGVLPCAPAAAYGRPEELKSLIDTAHGLGLCVYLDVVYNHFGPAGNYLGQYASRFFKQDHSAWGAHIDFEVPEVRRFFIGNALYWLMEYRFDGLRFDAVHAIGNDGFLREMASQIRSHVEPGRHVHLMLENEHNTAELMQAGYDAQWNDDAHNALHVLLTGETHGYYRHFAQDAMAKLARCLGEGFAWQGEDGRGTPSAGLPPTAFVSFLQNHDQIGNRADGRRLHSLATRENLRAATALQLMCPQVPLQFMGEAHGSRTPFYFFTDFDEELGRKVNEGRLKEIGADAQTAAALPLPNSGQAFSASCVDFAAESETPEGREWLAWHRELMLARQTHVAPRLPGARALGATVLDPQALAAAWRMGDGRRLEILVNFGKGAVAARLPRGEPLVDSRTAKAALAGVLPAQTCLVWLA